MSDFEARKAERRSFFCDAAAKVGIYNVAQLNSPRKFCINAPFNDGIRCAATRAWENVELNKPVYLLSLEVEEALRSVPGALARYFEQHPESVHAQSLSGVTLMMKSCRLVNPKSEDQRDTMQLLLAEGADPMVCCDVGRNLLHDLFWGANFPAGHARESEIFDILLELLTCHGRDKVIKLMMAPDHHGNTPLEFASESSWRAIIATAMRFADSAADETECAAADPPSRGMKRSRDVAELSTVGGLEPLDVLSGAGGGGGAQDARFVARFEDSILEIVAGLATTPEQRTERLSSRVKAAAAVHAADTPLLKIQRSISDDFSRCRGIAVSCPA